MMIPDKLYVVTFDGKLFSSRPYFKESTAKAKITSAVNRRIKYHGYTEEQANEFRNRFKIISYIPENGQTLDELLNKVTLENRHDEIDL